MKGLLMYFNLMEKHKLLSPKLRDKYEEILKVQVQLVKKWTEEGMVCRSGDQYVHWNGPMWALSPGTIKAIKGDAHGYLYIVPGDRIPEFVIREMTKVSMIHGQLLKHPYIEDWTGPVDGVNILRVKIDSDIFSDNPNVLLKPGVLDMYRRSK